MYQLSQERFYLLTEYLKGPLREWLQKERPGYTEVAKKCMEALGYYISPDSVKRANKVCNIWEPLRAAASRSAMDKKRLESIDDNTHKISDLTVHVAALHDDAQKFSAEIAELKRIVHHLCAALNIDVPPRHDNGK